jgi:hypothetical protein
MARQTTIKKRGREQARTERRVAKEVRRDARREEKQIGDPTLVDPTIGTET